MIAPLAPHSTKHAVPREPGPLALFFRRAIAAARRKPAVPEVQTTASGAGADWGDEMPPADSRMWHGDTEPRGFPVLGNQMLSEVRGQWNAFHDDDARPVPTFTPALTPAEQAAHADAMHEMSARYLPAAPDLAATFRRPVNGRRLPDQPRQPVFGEAPVASVLGAERDAARAAGERFRVTYEPASPRLLDQVLAGLRRL